MKLNKFKELYEDIFHCCEKILESKGRAYSGDDDRFSNFNRLAKELGLDRKVIWKVYFQKHLDAINSYIKGQYADNEPIKGRIEDAINYLLLLYGMIYEEQDGAWRIQKMPLGPSKWPLTYSFFEGEIK